jgi:hypothetical protein
MAENELAGGQQNRLVRNGPAHVWDWPANIFMWLLSFGWPGIEMSP